MMLAWSRQPFSNIYSQEAFTFLKIIKVSKMATLVLDVCGHINVIEDR